MIRLFVARRCAAVSAALVLVAMSCAAVADVVVLASKGAPVAAGATLRDESSLELPAGASVTVLLPSGTMRELKGPAKLKVADLTRGERPAEGLFDKVTGILQKSGGSESRTGAVRSALSSPGTRPLTRFSWTEVPVDAEGDVCVQKGAALSLVRGAGGKATRVTIVDMASNQRGEATFAEGSATTGWPTPIEPKVGKYAVLMPDRALRQIQLRVIDPLPARENVIRILHGARCEAQMQALVRELGG